MANQKITDLTSIISSDVASDDLFVLVDVDDTTMAASGTDKSITTTELAAALSETPAASPLGQWFYGNGVDGPVHIPAPGDPLVRTITDATWTSDNPFVLTSPSQASFTSADVGLLLATPLPSSNTMAVGLLGGTKIMSVIDSQNVEINFPVVTDDVGDILGSISSIVIGDSTLYPGMYSDVTVDVGATMYGGDPMSMFNAQSKGALGPGWGPFCAVPSYMASSVSYALVQYGVGCLRMALCSGTFTLNGTIFLGAEGNAVGRLTFQDANPSALDTLLDAQYCGGDDALWAATGGAVSGVVHTAIGYIAHLCGGKAGQGTTGVGGNVWPSLFSMDIDPARIRGGTGTRMVWRIWRLGPG